MTITPARIAEIRDLMNSEHRDGWPIDADLLRAAADQLDHYRRTA